MRARHWMADRANCAVPGVSTHGAPVEGFSVVRTCPADQSRSCPYSHGRDGVRKWRQARAAYAPSASRAAA